MRNVLAKRPATWFDKMESLVLLNLLCQMGHLERRTRWSCGGNGVDDFDLSSLAQELMRFAPDDGEEDAFEP